MYGIKVLSVSFDRYRPEKARNALLPIASVVILMPALTVPAARHSLRYYGTLEEEETMER
jgi:hypothetical protein